ncbi:cadherin-like beta sandwich domain-containing protein [Bacillus sp. ISL-7]|uniref:cadherin-like beta sandwich domain-containing protein n=1 Tax=Bacillus sp. ISL-7 TaxID=2819136 RepID=UPI001BE705E8|nr:cadherin-like beta sandwich domain-containing protein [Bacillus sp. ISL-7]MBT2734944.1 cadherin-like beta sandwich domain-containing protein [Bacillus sp. ISL-7]
MKEPIQSKALNVMLVISMVWMGVGTYIPTAYAETNTSPVQEDQQEGKLSKIEIEGIKLDQLFSADSKEYSATVKNEVPSIKLLVESSNPDSSITINGQTVISGVVGAYSLQTGENKFIISVDNGSNSTNTYTLTIMREENDNNLLRSIILSKGQLSPNFSSTGTDYKVVVPNDVPVITIKPASVETTSTIKVNETIVTKDGAAVELPVGESDIIIAVTAENGEKRIYTLHITRAAAEIKTNTNANANANANANLNQNNKPGLSQSTSQTNNRPNSTQPTSQQASSLTIEKTSKALLSSLSVSEGSWDSTFKSDEFTYHVTVSSDMDEVTLNPIAKSSNSEILIEGSTKETIKLEDDSKTIISIIVTNEDDRKTYVLVFDKES